MGVAIGFERPPMGRTGQCFACSFDFGWAMPVGVAALISGGSSLGKVAFVAPDQPRPRGAGSGIRTCGGVSRSRARLNAARLVAARQALPHEKVYPSPQSFFNFNNLPKLSLGV